MYKMKEGFIIRKIGGQIMAVPTGKMTSEIHGMIILTESGEMLWNAMLGGADEEHLVGILTDNYEVEKETALADVRKFISALGKQGALDE